MSCHSPKYPYQGGVSQRKNPKILTPTTDPTRYCCSPLHKYILAEKEQKRGRAGTDGTRTLIRRKRARPG
jgi:hypothetical protein